jgi:hypothetical protein
LEADQTVFSENKLNLTVLYPSMMDNLKLEGRPNTTSGILCLKCGNRKIVYSGDATIEAWESLSQKYKQKPLLCNVMTVPHHGGKVSKQNEAADQQKLYSEFVKPQYGIISVGSWNSHRHPLPEAINALRGSGIEVFCSQMTTQCCEDLERIRRIPRIITQPSRSSKREDKTQGGKSKNVACFGSLALEVSEDEIKVSSLPAFNRAFHEFRNIPTFTPICKR